MSWLATLLGNGGRQKGSIFTDVRELIKGKELDPNEALRLINEVNAAEARHRSVFVAGWRPAIGWTGAIVIFYHYVAQPFINFVLQAYGYEVIPPTLDLDQLWPVIMGMLGIAGARTYEKTKGKAH